MRRLRPVTALVATTCLLSPSLAAAEKGIGGVSIEAMVGGNAEVENDKYKVELGNQKGEIDGGDDDLEGNFGVAAAYNIPMEGGAWTLGPRLAIMTAEGDDSENVIQTVDIGGLVRFFFNEGKWRFFGSGASKERCPVRRHRGIRDHAVPALACSDRLARSLHADGRSCAAWRGRPLRVHGHRCHALLHDPS
jgi:hypothetical protein